jgi:Xaa-Pro aminopeptidase
VSRMRSARPEPTRLRRLRDRLHEERLDGLLVSNLSNIRYLTGFTGSSAMLLVEPGLATLVTDFRYETQAGEEVEPSIRVAIAADGLVDALAARIEEEAPGRRIGFEPASLTVRDHLEIGERCDTVIWDPAPPAVEALRACKDPGEVERIEEAVRIAERALVELLDVVRAGMTEREIAAELEYRLRGAGSGPLPFDPIVAAGARSALPHARPGDNRVEAGDVLLLDFGASSGGYVSDLTRVFVLGAPATWQREMHAAVRDACECGVAAVRAAALVRDVDAAARDHLAGLGLADRFGHSTGHGIGLDVHEAPRIHARGDHALRAGNVVTIEPGVYVPGRGGIRIEQDVVVEADGCRVLTTASTDLIEL